MLHFWGLFVLGLQTVLVHGESGTTTLSATASGYQHSHLSAAKVNNLVMQFCSNFPYNVQMRYIYCSHFFRISLYISVAFLGGKSYCRLLSAFPEDTQMHF